MPVPPQPAAAGAFPTALCKQRGREAHDPIDRIWEHDHIELMTLASCGHIRSKCMAAADLTAIDIFFLGLAQPWVWTKLGLIPKCLKMI